jgi:hypothetical protein
VEFMFAPRGERRPMPLLTCERRFDSIGASRSMRRSDLIRDPPG